MKFKHYVLILLIILPLQVFSAAQQLQQATTSAAQILEQRGQPVAARRVRMLGRHIAIKAQEPKPIPTLTQSFGKQCNLSQVPFVKHCDCLYFNTRNFDGAWFS